jgi:hypothetical protein
VESSSERANRGGGAFSPAKPKGSPGAMGRESVSRLPGARLLAYLLLGSVDP